MKTGVVLKRVGGFCHVLADGQRYICRLRGRLKLEVDGILPGDRVRIKPAEKTVEEILPRRVTLTRPPIANVDQVVIVISLTQPAPDWLFLDRLLVLVAAAGLESVICFNKLDLVDEPEGDLYARLGYRTFYTSTRTGEGIGPLREALAGRISCFAGASGVGKSALLNCIIPGASQQVGSVSRRLQRGRHTTRSVELLPLPEGGLVADTPGFSRLSLNHVEPSDLGQCFPEMAALAEGCQFTGCLHDQEPNCAVKEALDRGEVDARRYRSYSIFLQEIQSYQRRKY
ncbi:MAG: ribosome small subunit-dependent GTPase A [Limnochordia bacterium]|jgi:ribosome biogenesis GTPase|nr:ribosome small subunit-dependent GTPase A [Bacillota bacterium]